MIKPDIYSVVSRQSRHVRVAFREESDGLRQGKMRESKERRKTWFPFLFCPEHMGSCTYEIGKYSVFISISLHNRLCAVQKERTNQGFSSPFDSSAFPIRRLRILLRKTLPAIPFLLAYDKIDVIFYSTMRKFFANQKTYCTVYKMLTSSLSYSGIKEMSV